jgi:hypothetical protein
LPSMSSPPQHERDVSTTPGGAVSLPPGYPAYCIYIPTGMSQDFEKAISDKLQQWGIAMGANLFVAPWNVGDASYVKLMQKLGFTRRPAIILTDDSTLPPDSFIMKIDDPLVMRDVARLTEILPTLMDLILLQNYNQAAKEAISAKRVEKIRSISSGLANVLSKVNVTFCWKGVTVGMK